MRPGARQEADVIVDRGQWQRRRSSHNESCLCQLCQRESSRFNWILKVGTLVRGIVSAEKLEAHHKRANNFGRTTA